MHHATKIESTFFPLQILDDDVAPYEDSFQNTISMLTQWPYGTTWNSYYSIAYVNNVVTGASIIKGSRHSADKLESHETSSWSWLRIYRWLDAVFAWGTPRLWDSARRADAFVSVYSRTFRRSLPYLICATVYTFRPLVPLVQRTTVCRDCTLTDVRHLAVTAIAASKTRSRTTAVRGCPANNESPFFFRLPFVLSVCF